MCLHVQALQAVILLGGLRALFRCLGSCTAFSSQRYTLNLHAEVDLPALACHMQAMHEAELMAPKQPQQPSLTEGLICERFLS